MKILLATDGSDYSNAAVEELAAMPLPAGAEVRIISAYQVSPVISPIPAPMGGLAGGWQDAETVAQEVAEDAVESAAEKLKMQNPGLSVSTATIQGSPKHAILEDADTFGADLIVIGSHGRSGMGRFLMGSVSQSIALHAKCSVEIVRRQPH